MLRVGLTGGIACGKSHVARRWASLGIHVIDLDLLAHEALARGGAAYREVIDAFGRGIVAPDGSIDRKALGAIVFGDADARRRLNALVHPRVRAEEARRAAALDGPPGTVVATDAALLVESGIHLRFDRLVVAWCPPQEQVARLMRRDGIDESAARARIAAQMPVARKRAFAHYEIDTSGSITETVTAAGSVGTELLELARAPRSTRPLPIERALGSLVHGPREGPRGLTPRWVLDEMAAASGPEMERLASALRPPASGPWFNAAHAGQPGPAPATLVAPLVLWSLGRGGPDPPFLASAAASLARLTHIESRAIADACACALLLQAALTSRDEGPLAPPEEWAGLAERFGGATPSPAFRAVVGAVESHRGDVDGAREAARGAGGDPGLAGMLSGSLAGASEAGAGADLVRSLRTLWARPHSQG